MAMNTDTAPCPHAIRSTDLTSTRSTDTPDTRTLTTNPKPRIIRPQVQTDASLNTTTAGTMFVWQIPVIFRRRLKLDLLGW